MFEARDIVGQRLLRPLSAGKPVLQNQLRQQWRLRAGQTVELVMPDRVSLSAARAKR